MSSLNLVFAADVFIALFILFGVIGSIRNKARVGCWSNIYLFLGGSLMIASFVLNALSDEEPANVGLLAAFIGIASLIVASLVLVVLDRSNDQYEGMYSRGVLGAGMGAILLVAAIFIPIVPNTIIPIPSPTPIVAAVRNTPVAIDVVVTGSSDTTIEMQPTSEPTITRTPLPSPSPTRTRRAYIPPTTTPTPIAPRVADNCGATINVNANVRSEPTTDGEVVAIVPAGRYVSVVARNTENTWWQIEFERQQGWVFGDLLSLDEVCTIESSR